MKAQFTRFRLAAGVVLLVSSAISVSAADADVPGYNVFTRRDGAIRHFWGGEMGGATADPGQDPRGAPDFDPLWTLLDTTPEGRGTDWYPKLSY